MTNINITTQPAVSQNGKEVQVFQKGQVTALVSNLPGMETSKDLSIRPKSSLSNVSNTHIPAPQNEAGYHCHKSHRHKHRSSRLQTSVSTQNLEQSDKITYRKHNHHHYREKDYNSETNSAIEHVSRYNKRNVENNGPNRPVEHKTTSEKDYDIMDQSFKKATKIVNELTRSNRDSALYEKHRQKCITASEKYNSDILKHYNARKSASVLDFRSEIRIGPKYSETQSAEELDPPSDDNVNKRLYKKIQDSRSVKSLDFDSDSTVANGYINRNGKVDYTSEPNDRLVHNRKLPYYPAYYGDVKPRPTPPKKPIRLSLHKTQSLQSVETPPMTPNTSPNNKNNECRKRNYKGEIPLSNGKIEQNGHHESKWGNFNQKKGVEIGDLESGSWC